MDNVRRKHLSFRKARIKMLVSDQVAETCDACDRTEDLRVLHFSIYADTLRCMNRPENGYFYWQFAAFRLKPGF